MSATTTFYWVNAEGQTIDEGVDISGGVYLEIEKEGQCLTLSPEDLANLRFALRQGELDDQNNVRAIGGKP